MDRDIESILEINELDEKSVVEAVRNLPRIYDLVPINRLHWAFLPSDQDPYGRFNAALKKTRQKLTRYLTDEVVPQVLNLDAELDRDEFQLYFQERQWRDLLWDSATHGTSFSAEIVSNVLVDQWEAAAGRVWEEALFLAEREATLMSASHDGHSEGLTSRGLLFERLSWQCSVCPIAKATLKPIDTSLAPFDGSTAAAQFVRPSGRKVIVTVPVARQWKAKKKREEENEVSRLTAYLGELCEYFNDSDCDFEIHSPRIGKHRWVRD